MIWVGAVFGARIGAYEGSKKRSLAFFFVLAALIFAVLSLTAKPAYAVGFTVTKTADTNDGTCDSDCSLREAIIAANALIDVDWIFVPAGT